MCRLAGAPAAWAEGVTPPRTFARLADQHVLCHRIGFLLYGIDSIFVAVAVADGGRGAAAWGRSGAAALGGARGAAGAEGGDRAEQGARRGAAQLL
jgi:hypothetical protein